MSFLPTLPVLAAFTLASLVLNWLFAGLMGAFALRLLFSRAD